MNHVSLTGPSGIGAKDTKEEGRRKKEEYFSCLFSESLTQSYGNYQFSI
jgi:hypothetical protein